MTTYIDRTLSPNECSQSSGRHSRMVPWWTNPAQLTSTWGAGTAAASAATAASSVTSSRRTSTPGVASSSPSFARSMSVAITAAPSRAKASAIARPMPWAAAVIRVVFPRSRSLMKSSPMGRVPRAAAHAITACRSARAPMVRPGNPLPNVSTGLLTGSRQGVLAGTHVPDSMHLSSLARGLRSFSPFSGQNLLRVEEWS